HQIDARETDVDTARPHVYTVANSVTALRHALEHASAQRSRVGETLAKLDVEEADVLVEAQKVEADRSTAGEALRRAHEVLDHVRIHRGTQEAALAAARSAHDETTRRVRSGEQDLAAPEARAASLEQPGAASR